MSKEKTERLNLYNEIKDKFAENIFDNDVVIKKSYPFQGKNKSDLMRLLKLHLLRNGRHFTIVDDNTLFFNAYYFASERFEPYFRAVIGMTLECKDNEICLTMNSFIDDESLTNLYILKKLLNDNIYGDWINKIDRY
jgi:hypothetical protein